MQLHEERVVVEKQELDDKIAKLNKFVFGPQNTVFCNLSPVDQDLLQSQLAVMSQYSQILKDRIEQFKGV